MATKAAKEEKPAKLDVLAGRRAGQSVQLTAESLVIGSDEAATFTCPDADVEWSHARIFKQKKKFWVEDLQSQGGVYVNERRVLQNKALESGDTIGIGSVRLRFTWGAGANGNGNGHGNGADHASAGAGAPDVRVQATAIINAAAVEESMGRELLDTSASETEPSSGVTARGTAILATPSFASESAPTFPGTAGAPAESQSPPSETAATGAADAGAADMAALGSQDSTLSRAASAMSDFEATVAALSGATGAAVANAEAAQAPVDEMQQPATAEDLLLVIQALQEKNIDLETRLETAESELQRKRAGLSLATESFVDQLERAKERIATFAARHAETEALVARREEELAKLKAENAALEQITGAKTKDLLDKLEAMRREFDEIARVTAAKSMHLAKVIGEARTSMKDVPSAGSPALALAMATATQSQLAALVPGTADGLAASTAGGRSPSKTSRAQIQVIPGGALGAPSSTPGAAGAAAGSPTPLAAPRAPNPLTRILKNEWVGHAAIFVVVAAMAFAVIWLFMQPDKRGKGGTSGPEKPLIATPATGASAKGSTAASAGKPSGPPAAPVKPASAPSAAPKTSQAPAAPASPAPPPASQVAAAEGTGEDGIFGALRKAHRDRDEKVIAKEEQALIAKGKDILPQVKAAAEQEKQFNVRVSFELIARALEGVDSAKDIIEAMRATKAPDEKMRLAFMLGKLNKASDVPFLEEIANSEQDPMIKKYVVRALGNADGDRGRQVLEEIAKNNGDRNLRIESIRAIEEKGSPGSSGFLTELAKNEQDASIKSIAIRALANIGTRDSFGYFAQVLEGDERTNNRAEAAKYMARIGEPNDIAQLERLLQAEKVYYIRQKIQQAIETVQRRNGITPTPAAPDAAGAQPVSTDPAPAEGK